MDRLSRYLLPAALVAAGFVFTGCTGRKVMDTQYVEGVVTVDGQPVPEATVMFVPVQEGQGASATGVSDQNGVYKLTAVASGELAAEPEAGTLPGEYHVGVIKTVVESPMTEEEAAEKGVPYVPPDTYAAPQATHVVPLKFNDPKQSGLKVTVTEGQNTIPLELKTQ